MRRGGVCYFGAMGEWLANCLHGTLYTEDVYKFTAVQGRTHSTSNWILLEHWLTGRITTKMGAGASVHRTKKVYLDISGKEVAVSCKSRAISGSRVRSNFAPSDSSACVHDSFQSPKTWLAITTLPSVSACKYTLFSLLVQCCLSISMYSCYLVSSFAFCTGCVASRPSKSQLGCIQQDKAAGVAVTDVGQFIRLLTSFSAGHTLIR